MEDEDYYYCRGNNSFYSSWPRSHSVDYGQDEEDEEMFKKMPGRVSDQVNTRLSNRYIMPTLKTQIPVQYHSEKAQETPKKLDEKVFGVKLYQLDYVTIYCHGQFKEIPVRIPRFLGKVHEEWMNQPGFCKTDKLFLESATEKKVSAAISSMLSRKGNKVTDPLILATVTCQFIQRIPGGIFDCKELEDEFLSLVSGSRLVLETLSRDLITLVYRMPRPNQDLLFWLLQLLKQVCKSKSVTVGMISDKFKDILFPSRLGDGNENKKKLVKVLLSLDSSKRK